MAWDPQVYLKFAWERTRAAADLLARVPLEMPRTAVDLGCGPGNSTGLLRDRFPHSRLIGVDTSPEMLEAAAGTNLDAEWVREDAGRYEPPFDTDLIFANATLHWLENHDQLLPKLLSKLTPGGVLAVQMPDNFDGPAHSLLQEISARDPWRTSLAGLRPERPVARADAYYTWLREGATSLDIWRTEYWQVLEGDNPVLDWIQGTALRPYLAALPAQRHSGFIAEYADLLRRAYPKREDGTTLFPFRRLFIIARQ